MAETKMTKDELQTHIKGVVLDVLKERLGAEVKDVVEASVTAALKDNKPASLTAKEVAEAAAEGMRRSEEQVKENGGGLFVPYIRALIGGKGQPDSAVEFARKHLKNPKLVAEMEKALSTANPTEGGFLVTEGVSNEVIEILRPMSFMRGLVGGNVIQMPTGTFRMPKQTGGVSGSYIGENTNATKEEPTFGNIILTFRKLAVVVPISNDMIRYASVSTDAFVRRDVARGLASTENQAFYRGSGVDGNPKGLKNWIIGSQKVNANATVNLDNITTDLGKLLLKLVENNVPMTRPAWIMSPRTWNHLMNIRTTNGPYAFREEMLRGTLWGWPFAYSTQVLNTITGGGNTDNSEVALADFDDCAIGEALALRIDASDVAAYHNGSSVVAAFSQDQTVIRAIAEHDFALRRDVSAALLERVRWGA